MKQYAHFEIRAAGIAAWDETPRRLAHSAPAYGGWIQVKGTSKSANRDRVVSDETLFEEPASSAGAHHGKVPRKRSRSPSRQGRRPLKRSRPPEAQLAEMLEVEARIDAKAADLLSLEARLDMKASDLLTLELQVGAQGSTAAAAVNSWLEVEDRLDGKKRDLLAIEARVDEKVAMLATLEANLDKKAGLLLEQETRLDTKASCHCTNIQAAVEAAEAAAIALKLNAAAQVDTSQRAAPAKPAFPLLCTPQLVAAAATTVEPASSSLRMPQHVAAAVAPLEPAPPSLRMPPHGDGEPLQMATAKPPPPLLRASQHVVTAVQTARAAQLQQLQSGGKGQAAPAIHIPPRQPQPGPAPATKKALVTGLIRDVESSEGQLYGLSVANLQALWAQTFRR